MDIHCVRCGTIAVPAGHEDARAFFQCEKCNRVWMVHLTASLAAHARAPEARVLVVDDAAPLASLIELWLEDEGYDVVTAASGRQAMELIASHDPDIVLLDLIIPPPDGFAICRAARQRPRPPEIIVMTGLLDRERLRQLEDGVFHLLHKPLTQEVVLDAVARARRNRWASEHRETVQ
jgi:two-component system, OmpR family, response regulator